MTRPWELVARSRSEAGMLELRRRGDDDFLITVGGRVLMNSRAQRSEVALGTLGCAGLARASRPRVLIGGLGMGLTLRAALDALPADSRVTVAELNAVIGDWCEGPLAPLNGHALADPRVTLRYADVSQLLAEVAAIGGSTRFDAVLLDLYEGPHARTQAQEDPFYGRRALATTHAALRPGGTFAVWAENQARSFEQRLRRAGFRVTLSRPGRGGLRHAVYLATATDLPSGRGRRQQRAPKEKRNG